MEHEPHPEPRHETREDCAFAAARHGLPVYGEWTEEPAPSWEAGYRSSEIQDRGFCSRVFLAPAQGL